LGAHATGDAEVALIVAGDDRARPASGVHTTKDAKKSGPKGARASVDRNDPKRKRFKSTLSFSASRVVTVANAAHSPSTISEGSAFEGDDAPPAPQATDTAKIPAPNAETQAWGKSSGTINKRSANIQKARRRSDTFLRKHTIIAERYQVMGVLGSGGMATVYRVRDQELEEDVALKLLKTDNAQGSQRPLRRLR